MNYPLISEYIEAIRCAKDNFATLTYLRPVLDKDGSPIMSSGNFAAVFKVQDENGKCYALKCFIKDQQGRKESYRLIADALNAVDSEFIVNVKYLENELFVDSQASSSTEFPVVLMDWVEGNTLDRYLRANLTDVEALQFLVWRFSLLVKWLILQPFAHGDLKPDNIIVRPDDSLVLVDYDGMFVPAMQGQQSRELGSPDFRHPQRNEDFFNERIDDFPAASILLSLKAIALNPDWLIRYGAADRLLFCESDYHDLSHSSVFKEIFPSSDVELNCLYSLFLLAHSKQNLKDFSHLFEISRPVIDTTIYSTKVSDEDIANGICDEYGVIYSSDGKRLLKCTVNTLKDYCIRQGTKVICNQAFVACSLKSITIPISVISIGDEVFDECYLTHINIPDSVSSIGGAAFYNCIDLTNINIPSSVTSIEGCTFYGCKSLKTINIPNSITSIGWQAFMGCCSLTNVTIPNSVTEIDESAFYNCDSLTSITISNAVTRIGPSVFCNCNSLTNVVIPNSVTHVSRDAFRGCSSLKSITIPNSVLSIERHAFIDCSSLTSINVDHGNKMYDSRNNCNAIVQTATNTIIVGCSNTFIPESISCIGDSAFSRCINLISLNIPNSVREIGYNAFINCSNLTNISFSDSIIKIADGALKDTLWFKNKPNGLVYAGLVAYKYKGDMPINTNIILNEGTTSIEDFCFKDCTSLINISIPDSVTRIGTRAFDGCNRLADIIIPNSVTEIGEDAFRGTTWIRNQPEGLVYAGLVAYNYKGDMPTNTSIRINDGTKAIAESCFNTVEGDHYNCSGLTSITIPNSITKIGKFIFGECYNLSLISIDHDNMYYDSRDNCNAIIETATNTLIAGCKKTIIPDSVTAIGDYAFWGCFGMKSITIPNSVTQIGKSAFSDCIGLSFVSIPDSVIAIGDNAFAECCSLISITIPNSVTTIGEDPFFCCNSIKEIHIPKGTFEQFVKLLGDKYKDILIEENIEALSTAVTKEDLANGVKDKYGAIYSHDGQRLLKGNNCHQYYIRQGTKIICDHAFCQCWKLSSITIPNSVTHIGDDAFAECSSLSSVNIPNSVIHIGDGAFAWCYGLSSVNIPDSVTHIGTNPFSRSGICLIECNNPFFEVDECALYSKGKKTIITFFDKSISDFNIPNLVTHIGDEAFAWCENLSSVTIPDSVIHIGDGAFAWCYGLSSVTIPDSVIHIGDYAFSYCVRLSSFTIPNSLAHIGDSAFAGCESLSYIIIPRGSWAKFEKILSNDLHDMVIEK